MMNTDTLPLPPMAMPRESLPPNMYSGAYIIGQHFCTSRYEVELLPESKGERVKIYRFRGAFYVVPFTGTEPPAGFRWEHIGRGRDRDIYMAKGRSA